MGKRLAILLFGCLIAAPAWAAVDFQTLNFVANTGGTTTTVSTAFQAKGGVLISHGKTAEGESAGDMFTIGLFDCTNDKSISRSGDDAVATTNVGRGFRDTDALQIFSNGNPTVPTGGTVSSVTCNTSNIVLTHNATPADAWEISAWIWGGADITNVYVGQDTIPTTVSTKDHTGPNFQPDFILLINTRRTAGGTSTNTIVNIGIATATDKEFSVLAAVRDSQTTSGGVDGESKFRDNAVLMVGSVPTAEVATADLSAWLTNGFQLNYTTVDGTAWVFGMLAIKGGQWNSGVAAKPTSASAQNFSVGFTPRGIGFMMSSPTSVNIFTSNSTTTVGAWDGTTETYAGGFHNDAINTVAKSSGGSTKVLCELNATACADGTTLGTTSTITWDNTGTAHQLGWWAVGDNAGSKGRISNAGRFSNAGRVN